MSSEKAFPNLGNFINKESVIVKGKIPKLYNAMRYMRASQYSWSILVLLVIDSWQESKSVNRLVIIFLISRPFPITKVALELLGHRSVLILGFPSHTTQLFQPLDLVLFGVIKTELKTLVHIDEVNQQAGYDAKRLQAFKKATTSAIIGSAFEYAGIVSNLEKVRNDVHLRAKNFLKIHNSIQFVIPTCL